MSPFKSSVVKGGNNKGNEHVIDVDNVMGNFFANDYPICCPGLSHGRCLTLGALLGKALAEDTTVQAIEVPQA